MTGFCNNGLVLVVSMITGAFSRGGEGVENGMGTCREGEIRIMGKQEI